MNECEQISNGHNRIRKASNRGQFMLMKLLVAALLVVVSAHAGTAYVDTEQIWQSGPTLYRFNSDGQAYSLDGRLITTYDFMFTAIPPSGVDPTVPDHHDGPPPPPLCGDHECAPPPDDHHDGPQVPEPDAAIGVGVGLSLILARRATGRVA